MISKLESGEMTPTGGHIAAFAKAVGEPIEAMFSPPGAGLLIFRDIPDELRPHLEGIVAQVMRNGRA